MSQWRQILLIIFALLSQSLAQERRNIMVTLTETGFNPEFEIAQVGDFIKIIFTMGGASLTQSTLDDPCVPLKGGIHSGVKSINQDFGLTVMSDNDMFFFNSQTSPKNFCKAGVVFSAVASPEDASIFKANAMNSDSGNGTQVPNNQDSNIGPDATTVKSSRTQSHTSQDVTTVLGTKTASMVPTIFVTASSSDTSGVTSPTIPMSTYAISNAPASTSSVTNSPNPTSESMGEPSPSMNPKTSGKMGMSYSQKSVSRHRTAIVVAVIGALLGTLIVIVVIVVLVRRRQRQELLLPTRSTIISAVPISRGGQTHARRWFSKSGGRWNPLTGGDERRITPFLQINDSRPVSVDSDPHTTRRHLSDSTLVSTAGLSGTPLSSSSLVAQASDNEKTVTFHRGRVVTDSRLSNITPSSSRLGRA